MYNNPYMNVYNPQMSIDKLNEQINNLEKLKSQLQQPVQQPTNLTQNFQLAPQNRDVIKYAASIEEVQRDMVIGDTPYFSKDMSVVWIKNTKGEIRTYELNEIIPKDEKDIQIELLQEQQKEKDNWIDALQAQINELKGMINNDANVRNVDATKTTTNTTRDDESTSSTIEESKSTSIPRVSTSKKK